MFSPDWPLSPLAVDSAAAEPLVAMEAADGRLIVKYETPVARVARTAILQGRSFDTVTGSGSLDDLNAKLGVSDVRPLFHRAERGTGGTRSSDWFATIRRRFPERAARAASSVRVPDLSSTFVIQIDPALDVHTAALEYATDPSVISAEPDYIVQIDVVTDDPLFSSLWGLSVTDAPGAWDVTDGSGTVVAVVDTGSDFSHPDLAANLWTNTAEIPGNHLDDDENGFIDDAYGWDFENDDADPTDRNGHGTHVAGTVAAVGNNGVGVIGMAWGAKVMTVRGFNAKGKAFTSVLAKAVVYATANGADVINASWRIGRLWGALYDAVAAAQALGVAVVSSAGNSGGLSSSQAPGVISVAATAADDSRTSFSNFGDGISVAAPGDDILSLRAAHSANVGGTPVGDDYLLLSGTSMSAPHVSALAALLISADPTLTLDEIRWHIELNADQPGIPGYEGQPWNPHYGWGRISAARVFDVPPVTTRLLAPRLERRLSRVHAFVNTAVPIDSELDLVFTALDPVAWTATASPPAIVTPASGAQSAKITVSYNTTGLTPGSYDTAVTIDAPSAVDGGASLASSVFVHRDERIGLPWSLVLDGKPPNQAVVVGASNKTGTLLAWTQSNTDPTVSRWSIRALHVANDGTVTGPILLREDSEYKKRPFIATDGHDYLVMWTQSYSYWEKGLRLKEIDRIVGLRVGPTGLPIDGVPIEVASNNDRPGKPDFVLMALQFVSGSYSIVIGYPVGRGRIRLFVRRLTPDGVLKDKAVRIYSGYDVVHTFACAPTSCLIAWAGIREVGSFERRIFTLQIVDDKLVSSAFEPTEAAAQIVDALFWDGSAYVVVGRDYALCSSGGVQVRCRHDVIAARLSEDGKALNGGAVTVLNNNSVEESLTYRQPLSVIRAGDGLATVFSVLDYRVSPPGFNIFVARMTSDLTLLDSEDEGLLAFANVPTWGPPEIVQDALATIVARFDEEEGTGSPRINVVRMLSATLPADYVSAEIGSIGTLAVNEGQIIKVA